TGPREILFIPAKDPRKEVWNGVRMSPSDPGIESRTGFVLVKPFSELRVTLETLMKSYGSVYTILPYTKELGGYPHEKETVEWLKLAAPLAEPKDIRKQIWALRLIKSPTEIGFLRQA